MSVQELSPSRGNEQLSRRDFLKLSSCTALFMISNFVLRFIPPLRQQHEALTQSQLSIPEFLARNPELPEHFEFGCTFSVDYFTQLMPDAEPAEVVQLLVEKLGIKQIRFPIRWSSCVTADGSLDLDLQLKYLENFRKAGVSVFLSLGIKSARWPETHIPEFVLQKLKAAGAMAPDGSHLTGGEPLALEFFAFAEQALQVLVREHGFAFAGFQPENEHAELFGGKPYRFTFSDSYLHRLIELINSFQPGAPILLNAIGIFSSYSDTMTGNSSLHRVAQTLATFKKRFPENTFRLGIDIYEETQFTPKLPFTELRPDTLSILTLLYGKKHIQQLIADLAELGILTEITELQFERWGVIERLFGPGTVQHLQMMLLRVNQLLYPAATQARQETKIPQKILLRLWGIEQALATLLGSSRVTHQHEVAELIQAFTQD